MKDDPMNITQQLRTNGYLSLTPMQQALVVPVYPMRDHAQYQAVSTPIKIAVINKSTIVTDYDLRQAVIAIQTQVHRDFYPAWAIDATITWFAPTAVIPSNFWQIVLFDTADVAGALGYHDLTPSGQPLGKIFAKTAATNGYSWTVTLSHEIVEMLVDPYVNLTVFNQTSDTAGRLYAYETADAVEDDHLGYRINGVLVSDFVFPAWFDGFRPESSTRFSQMNNVHAPFQLAKGGYASYYDVTVGGWKQTFAMTEPGFKVDQMLEYAPRVAKRFGTSRQMVTSTY